MLAARSSSTHRLRRAGLAGRTLTAALICASLAGCASLLESAVEPPDVRLAGFSLLEPGLFETRAEVDLRFLNPNRFDIVVDALEVDLEVEGADFAEGRSFDPFTLPARQEIVVPVGIWVQTSGIIEALMRIGVSQQVSYRLDGEADLVQAPVGSVSFAREGEVRLPDLAGLERFRDLELVDPRELEPFL